MAWGPGLHCCWAFVHQTSPKLGCEIVEVGWDFCFCPQRPNSLPGAGPSTGALLKVAFICAGIVDVRSKLSLSEQLLRTFGGGFELHTWSELPHGSGLGTSSILAGAALAALQRAAGRAVGTEALIHAVLHLEQLLTTGMGLPWVRREVTGTFPSASRGFPGLADSLISVLLLKMVRASFLLL